MAFDCTSAVFVKKLNRIYIFGGTSEDNFSDVRFHDNIWYIDLIPSSVTNHD
jgi:hypothetical protein